MTLKTEKQASASPESKSLGTTIHPKTIHPNIEKTITYVPVSTQVPQVVGQVRQHPVQAWPCRPPERLIVGGS